MVKDDNIETEYRFGVVEEGKLYRSKQPDEKFLEYLREVYHIKTIVNLRRDLEIFEKEFARKHGINLIEIKMGPYRKSIQEDIDKFFEIINNPLNHPILVHCRGGIDRTGVMAAIYRIEQQSWSLDDAKKEMEDFGHIPFFHPGMFKYLNEKYGNKK